MPTLKRNYTVQINTLSHSQSLQKRRYGGHVAPPSAIILFLGFPPTTAAATLILCLLQYFLCYVKAEMLSSILFTLFLPFLGMIAVFIVYRCLLWYVTTRYSADRIPVKLVSEKGLSSSELEKLPKITGKELVMGSECAICLDEIKKEQPARLVPGCTWNALMPGSPRSLYVRFVEPSLSLSYSLSTASQPFSKQFSQLATHARP
ncbi:hypothetical protein PIB30_046930 [Stylosanthes scabra]|uniref:Uncharacterized protein n=1 Tax=Stylosanthes scabra TaxID=79078 RepID=A0ABU6YEU7_9FABA|nr:hypothetical protein [Stylosanthes scabra]